MHVRERKHLDDKWLEQHCIEYFFVSALISVDHLHFMKLLSTHTKELLSLNYLRVRLRS
jgi:hypothetical protein